VPDLPISQAIRGSFDGAYRLQVFVNGRNRNVIAEFRRAPDGAFYARPSELKDSGILAPASFSDKEIALDSIPGLRFRYDEVGQAIYFDAPESLVAPNVYSATSQQRSIVPARSDFGAALNYDVYSTTGQWTPLGGWLAPGQSLTVDGRIFSPLGVLRQTAIAGATEFQPTSRIRLESSWEYQDETHDLTGRVGDTITSGLAWTRPIRIGGAQLSHDYSTRPDLVTGATPTINGSAAVPTAVDVFVNNIKVFSQSVESGPFQIENLPTVGGGLATVTTVDASGRPVSVTLPFFANPDALRPGVFEFSGEAGYPRLNYAVDSFDYGHTLVANATARYGVNNYVTVAGHGEGGAGLINVGAGALFNVFDRASFDAALAGSKSPGGNGLQVAMSAQTAFLGLIFQASTQRSFGRYADLAYVTAPSAGLQLQPGLIAPTYKQFYLSTSSAPPRALDSVTVGVPNVFGRATMNVSFVNVEQMSGTKSRVASAGASANFPHNVSVSANAYVDLLNHRNAGVFAGLNIQLGGALYASVQTGVQGGAFTTYAESGSAPSQDVGDYGWRVFDAEGANRYSGASGTYMSPVGRAVVQATRFGSGNSSVSGGTAEFAGSLAVVGNAVAAGPVTGDAFAVVNAGAPGVVVTQDNRPVGRTGLLGTLMVPDLRPFQDNKIGIDPTTLPANAVSQETELILRPRFGSGVLADYAVQADPRDAEVILVDAAGKPIAAGASAQLQGHGVRQAVGYDGRVYFTALSGRNVVEVGLKTGACAAEFDYAPRPSGGPRPTIGPVTCR